MPLNDLVATAFNGAAAKLAATTSRAKRSAILYAICAFCGVCAAIFAASASVLALEPVVGMVYARLILAGAFALIVATILLGLWLASTARTPAAPQPALHAQPQTAQRSAQFAQLAMIVEAVMLGYSMARRR